MLYEGDAIVGDSTINQKLGARIQALRNRAGYTQQIFSEMVGLTPNYLSDIERGNSFPSPEKLVMIANTLDCSADELFCDLIDKSSQIVSSDIAEKINSLPKKDRERLCAVICAYIENT